MELANLKMMLTGRELNDYQRSLAIQELEKLEQQNKDHVGTLAVYRAHLKKSKQRLKELKAWKADQIKLMTPFFDYMQNHKEVKVGESCTVRAIELIEHNKDLREFIQDNLNACYENLLMKEQNY